MGEIVPFDFSGHQVRVVMIDSEPWWVVNDVCTVLEITQTRNVVARLDGDDVRQTDSVDSLGRRQPSTNVVNETGLYELIFRSDKPQAKTFRRWVTSEVLPQIRKTGSYSRDLSPAEFLVQQAQMLLDQERRVAAQERQTAVLEQRMDSIEQKTDWFTALGYAKREHLPTNHEYLNRLGRAASRISKAAGEQPSKVYNELFGEVNSYPQWALSEAAGGMA